MLYHGFYGNVEQWNGYQDFEDREKRKQLTVTQEAWYAENMANLFLIEIMQGHFDDFNTVSVKAFENMSLDLPTPHLDVITVDAIRNYLSALLQSWNGLSSGQTMLLTFEL